MKKISSLILTLILIVDFTSVLFLAPQKSEAAGAYVNGTFVVQDASDNSYDLPAQNHTAGNLLVVMVKYEGAAMTITVTDTAGNTYTPRTQRNDFGLGMQMFYAKNITGNASNVITIAYSASRLANRAIVHQYSGMDTVDPYDQENWGDDVGATTAMSTGNVTTTQNDEVIVAMAGEFGPQTSYTPGTNFDERFDLPVDAGAGGTASEDRFVSSTGTYNATMTQSSAQPWMMIMSTFKVAADAAPPRIIRLRGTVHLYGGTHFW